MYVITYGGGLLAICREPMDQGSCSGGNYKRFYYDEEYQECRAFMYTGCGGNRNNFESNDACYRVCRCKLTHRY